MQGYIKLYRKLLCNPIFKNPYLLQLFVYCLLKANHSEGKAFYGADEIILKPGQFVTGRFELSAALGGNASSTYKRLKRLESLTMLGLQSNNKNTLVTVLNWESYQIDKSDLDNEVTADGQESNRKVTTKGQQSNTNKNVKNDKNERMKENIYSDYTENPNLLKALKDFEIMRNSMKNGKFTDQAKKLLLTELNKLADTDEKKIAILKQSIFYGWKGVFPLKQGQAQKSGFDNFEGRKYDGKALEAAWVEKSRKPTFNNFENRTYDTASLKEKLLKKGRGEL